MKKSMMLGGLVGFLLGTSLALFQGCPWSVVFWRASASALICGLMLRWWMRQWLSGFRASQEAARLRQATKN